MGLILMPFLMLSAILAFIAIKRSGVFNKNRGIQNKYLLILLGAIFAILGMIVMTLISIETNERVYAFTPVFRSFFLSMGLSTLAIILSFNKNIIVEKISNLLAVSAALILILSFLGTGLIYNLLGITVYY